MTRTLKPNTIVLLLLLTIEQTTLGQNTFKYNSDFDKVLAQSKDPNSKLYYNKLIKRFTANDTTLTDFEVLALLIGFTDMPDYKPYEDIEKEREIFKCNEENRYQQGLSLANKFLKTHPLSVSAIFEKSYSYYKLGQKDSAQYYLYQGRRILKAMQFSGNGKSAESPIFALGPTDGQSYIHKFISADIGMMGSENDKNGNFLDVLYARYKDGKTLPYYFIIQHAKEKMFNGKSLREELNQQKKIK
jgi:hypothetical protein